MMMVIITMILIIRIMGKKGKGWAPPSSIMLKDLQVSFCSSIPAQYTYSIYSTLSWAQALQMIK